MAEAKDSDEAVVKALRTLCQSLESHLEYINDDPPEDLNTKFGIGDGDFQRKTIKEYAASIFWLAKLL